MCSQLECALTATSWCSYTQNMPCTHFSAGCSVDVGEAAGSNGRVRCYERNAEPAAYRIGVNGSSNWGIGQAQPMFFGFQSWLRAGVLRPPAVTNAVKILGSSGCRDLPSSRWNAGPIPPTPPIGFQRPFTWCPGPGRMQLQWGFRGLPQNILGRGLVMLFRWSNVKSMLRQGARHRIECTEPNLPATCNSPVVAVDLLTTTRKIRATKSWDR